MCLSQLNITCYNRLLVNDIMCYNIITSSRKLVITRNVTCLKYRFKEKEPRSVVVQKGRKMATNDEANWFGQTNKYKYQDLMIAMYEKDVIDIKTAHKKLGGTGVWIDTGRFTKGTHLYNPEGLYHLFGEYSSQGPDEVRDLMIGWIYDNYKNVKSWT